MLEDVQWLDGASRELVAALAQEAAAAQVVLVATYRPGAAPPWMDRPQATQLSLLPLSVAEAAELASSVVGRSGAAVEAIVERAEGNPFFIEELSLTFRANREVPAGGLPESILDVVSSRIAPLGAGARRVLVTASVAGRSCPLPLLRTLLPKQADVETAVDELARLELVYLKTRGLERSVVFRHAVTQEVAYGLLSAADRRAVHGSAARALEAQHAERCDEVIELLAHHHARGDDPERAVDVLSRALVKAVGANALDAAQSCFDEAIRIFEELPSTPENRRRRMQLLVAEHSVPLFFLSLRVEEYLRMLDTLEPEAIQLADPAVLGMLCARRGHCLWWVGRFDEAVASARRALELLEPLRMPVLAVHTFMMNSLYAKGDLRSVLLHQQRTLEVLERERNVRWSAYVLGVIAWAHARLGNRDEAVALGQRTLQLARDRADPSISSFAHWSLAMVLATVGELGPGLEHAERAVEEAPTPADRMWAESVRAGLHCRRPEDAARGTATLGALVSVLRRSNQLAAEDLFIPALGEGYVRLGRLDDGRRVFEELLACAERHGMRYLEAFACEWLAKIAQQLDRPSAHRLRERSKEILSDLAVPIAPRLTLTPPGPSS